jgi:hypothetical protein
MIEPTQTTRRTHAFTPFTLVVMAGLATSAVALAGVWWVGERFGEPVMSWYVYHFIPIGAGIVGLVAASGYLIAAQVFGLRVGKRLVWVFFALQIIAYVAAQCIEFRSRHLVYSATGEPVGFWTYFHYVATSYVLEQGGRDPIRLEYLGYLFRALEIAAFAGGAAFLMGVLTQSPYCAACGRYLKSKRLATIPAGHFVEIADDATADEAEQALLGAGQTAYDALATIAQAGEADVFAEQVKDHPPVLRTSQLPSRLDLELTYCPGCLEASLAGTLVVKKPGPPTKPCRSRSARSPRHSRSGSCSR